MTIEKAGTAHIEAIRMLAGQIWPVCYSGIISKEQIDYMLNLFYSFDSLHKQFTSDGHTFFIALENNHPVGFASFSKKTVADEKLWRLHKLYVLPELQGSGIGKALLERVIEGARKSGALCLELNVNKKNPAFHFYVKTGFIIREEQIIDIGNGFVMDDYIMIRDLTTPADGSA